MTSRRAYLEYSVRGAEGATGQVVRLSDALERQKRRAMEAAPAVRRAGQDVQHFGAINAAAATRITASAGALGPLAAGLGSVARAAPGAAAGLLRVGAAAERASLLSRALNTAVIGGAGMMTAAGVAAIAYADNIMRGADAYASQTARIKIFSESAFAAAQAERGVAESARETRTSLEATTALYTRVAPAIRDFGMAQEQALKIVELTSKALLIQGATVREVEASTIQFSQAIASGVLRGDELRSLLESSPQLLRYIAQNLEMNGKVGVAFSQIRQLGHQGLLTTDKLLKALLAAQPAIERDFVNAPKTAQQGWQILSDTITRTIGQIAKVTGAQAGIFDWLAELTDAADEFRKKIVMDPKSIQPMRDAMAFVGQAAEILVRAGEAVAGNWDVIVTVGQAIIALKLSEAFATWTAGAARMAMSMRKSFEDAGAAARFAAAATLGQEGARNVTVARDARAVAEAALIAVKEKSAKADLLAAQAAVARTAADAAAANAADIRTASGAKSAATKQAEALATQLNTQATRLETQAKAAETAATNASTAASARNAIAQQAEAVATGNVTRAMQAKAIAGRAGAAVLAALGGWIGVATIALGGLAFAIFKANEAYEKKMQAQREAMVVSDRLRMLTDQMTAATWAEIPALKAKTAELLEQARAAREAAEAERDRLRAEKERTDRNVNRGGTMGLALGAASGWSMNGVDARIARVDSNLTAAQNDEWKKQQELERQNTVEATQLANRLRSQLNSGKDEAGRLIDDQIREHIKRRLGELFSQGQRGVDRYQQLLATQEAAIAAETDPERRKALQGGLTVMRRNFEANASLVSTADTTPVTPPAKPEKPTRTTVPGDVQAVLRELIAQQYLPKEGLTRFSLQGGRVMDSATGGVMEARSEDEARAAARYVEQIEAINKAKDKEIALTGKSREELRQAASARLDYALKTSQAAQGDERWADMMAEVEGETRALVKAEREITDLRSRGVQITDEAAAAYLGYVRGIEQARRAAAALSKVESAVKPAVQAVMQGVRTPTDARGNVDTEAAVRQIEERKEAIRLETERRVRAEIAKEAEAGAWSQERLERELAERIKLIRLAVEAATAEEILAIRRQGTDEAARYNEDQARKYAELIESGFRDVVFGKGTVADLGRSVAQMFLEELYVELIGNPLRQRIRAIFEELRQGRAGGRSVFDVLFASLGGGRGEGHGDGKAGEVAKAGLEAAGAAAKGAGEALGAKGVETAAKKAGETIGSVLSPASAQQAVTAIAAAHATTQAAATDLAAATTTAAALGGLATAATAAAAALAAIAAQQTAKEGANVLANILNSAPGRADGGIPYPGPGMFRGAGGPRDDLNLVRISDGEYVVNARSTRKYLPLIDAINADRIPRFADGGMVGASPVSTVPAPAGGGRSGGGTVVFQIDRSIHAPGADAAALRRVEERQEALERELPGVVIDLTRRARKDGLLE